MKTDFQLFIEEEVSKVRNTGVPVKASLSERLLVRKIATKKLHPNPEDEFCFPDIGPNEGIISTYTSTFADHIKRNIPLFDEPLFVQKIRPSGYMILNGHHRWAAARRLGIKQVPISIVNAVFDGDIRLMLEKATHERRATLDLDEVVFAAKDDTEREKHAGLFGLGIQKKRLRLGIPALFNDLKIRGYDIWVYSSEFYSIDDIKRYFKHYSVDVDGIITGMKKRSKGRAKSRKLDELLGNRYKTTLHIDRELLLMTKDGASDFREDRIKREPERWAETVIDALDGIENEEK